MKNLLQVNNRMFLRITATIYLVLMNLQYFLLEGGGVSQVKVVAMCASPIIWLFAVPRISIAFICGVLYLSCLFMSMYLRFDAPRLETLGYSVMFFSTYAVFYNLIYAGAFTKEYFQKLMRFFLWTYIIVLIIQQIASIAGAVIPEINLFYDVGDFRLKVPSLSLEPSHSARIMAAIFYGFVKTTEIIKGRPVTFKDMFGEYRTLTIAFLYAMISMYSGTAIFMLAILLIYFFQRKQQLYFIPIFVILYLFVPDLDYNPVQRAVATSEATLTGEVEEVINADGSAAARVAPVLNALDMDFSDSRTWLGYGTDASKNYGYLSQNATIWTDRGVICYFIGWILVFCCAIKPFFSIPTLIFVVGLAGGLFNVYYCWGVIMIFT